MIVQTQSSQSILPAWFSTSHFLTKFQFSRINKLYKEKKETITKGFTAWAQPKIPPLSLNSVLIKNSNSIPQGFALRPAVSLAPSLKEIATLDESA